MLQNKFMINDPFIVIVLSQLERKFTISGIRAGGSLILPTNEVLNLGVVFNKHLNMRAQVNSVCRSAYVHLRNIGWVRSVLSLLRR